MVPGNYLPQGGRAMKSGRSDEGIRHCTQITSESCAEQIQICKAAEGSDAGIAD